MKSGGFELRAEGPFSDFSGFLKGKKIPKEWKLNVRQLGGPPKCAVPWYTLAPFNGTKFSMGTSAGYRHGPVLRVVHVRVQQDVHYGYVRVECRNPHVPEEYDQCPFTGMPATYVVNMWCSHNNDGHVHGILFCKEEWDGNQQGYGNEVLIEYEGRSYSSAEVATAKTRSRELVDVAALAKKSATRLRGPRAETGTRRPSMLAFLTMKPLLQRNGKRLRHGFPELKQQA